MPADFPFVAFDPESPIRMLKGALPHWRQGGVTYFVTFRLADSLPQQRLAEWQCQRQVWLNNHPRPWSRLVQEEYWRLFPARIETWLDAGHGSCILRHPVCRIIVENAMGHFDRKKYVLDESVVMPNHVHAILVPDDRHELSGILHSWKSYTAKLLNRALARAGPLWQKESFDHIVRSGRSLDKFRQYIRDHQRPVCG